MQALREWYDARGYLDSIARMDFLQADNQLRTFTKETGGQAFFPRFYGEFPRIFQAISQALKKYNFNRTETAKGLGISRRALVYKLQRLRELGYQTEAD